MCFSLAQREALQGRDRVSLLAKPGEQALNVLIAHGREGSEFAQPVPRKLIHLHEEGSSLPEPSAYLLRQRPTTERGARGLHWGGETEQLAPKRAHESSSG